MQEKKFVNLKTPARYIKGVGPKRGELLSRIGIETIGDILYYLPKRYEDRSNIIPIKDLKAGENQTIQGEIIVSGLRRAKSGMPIFQIAITDSTGIIHAIWFNQPYLKDLLKKGDKVILYGRVDRYDKLQIVQPEYEIIAEEEIASSRLNAQPNRGGTRNDEVSSLNVGRIVPIYAMTAQLTQKYLRSLIFKTIAEYSKLLTERLPTYMIAREKLVDIRFAMRNIHFPVKFEMLEKAYKRIVFEEFLILQLALAIRKMDAGHFHAGSGKAMAPGKLLEEFKRALPFELTEGQKNAIAEIERDMSGTKPMNRLLEGDVGSGKTIVAAHALTLAAQNGFQAVLMAPTEVLARQHFIVLSELLMPLGINIVLLLGGIDPKARQALYSEIKEGVINVVVGTHAIIQEGVEFKKLGVAIIDEQHKFGVEQRALLRNKGLKGINKGSEGIDKGENPHVLVMTATPIPRTLALTVYGDLDISIIKELPKGRKPIVTYWVEEGKRDEMYEFAREELKKGRQVYVVCPLIDRRSSFVIRDSYKATAVETFERLRDEVFTEYEVGLLHGRMNSKDKEKIMRDFKKGKIKVLVSTIVIEVGIDVPNASVMLIENAERFGLAQLHQLRGRIGRGDHESYCILLSEPGTEAAVERLKAIEGTLDGFEIAEVDMDIRGPGELFGTRQHGLPEIRFGNIAKDIGIMEAARKEAFALVARDPGLREEHHQPLKRALGERFRGKMELIRVG